MFRKTILFIFIFGYINVVWSDQKIEDFYLSNYKDSGSKDWEVKGREATVSGKYVNIDEMEGTYFQEDDAIDVKADKATLDKDNMDVHLEDNVRINSQQGINLNTDSLDWDRSSNTISTDKEVEVTKEESLKVKAKGLDADTELKKVNFQKEVEVDLFNNDDVIKINCDGPLEIEYEEGKAIFNNNVVADNVQGKMIANKATVYFDSQNKSIVKIVAEGDVKIIKDDNVTFSERATYLQNDKKIILEGRPRLVIFPKDKPDFFGE